MPVASITDDNIDMLHNLHPPSLNLTLDSPRRPTRQSAKSRRRQKGRFTVSPNEIMPILSRLSRGKAPGPELDSLDIFIKMAGLHRRSIAKNERCKIDPTTLATFFTIIANGEVSPAIRTMLQTTYLVALEKDPSNKRKLRPLGIPSAIRRITAVCIISKYRATFAEHLLPFNYALGVSGGVDFIVNAVRLGVDKYISEPERNGNSPTRSLISLDISNMFNAVSRQKCREIIATNFPELQDFIDMLYQDKGQTLVRKDDGTWTTIPVREGFSQGCPASPLFAALVLNYILRKINTDLIQ